MAVMKKLAGTRWGTNIKILTQVYTGSVGPHLEYASSAWSTAAKVNTDHLTKVQNAGLRLITGGTKTTPIAAMEKVAGLLSPEERWDEKLLRQSEKMTKLQYHPLHSKFQPPTKTKIKKRSPNHQLKALQQKHSESLPPKDQQLEMLQDFEEWSADEPPIILSIPGVGAKENHTDTELKSPTLESLDRDYHPTTWTNAVRNGGGGIIIKFPDGSCITKSVATGQLSTNFRAEKCALLHAAHTLNIRDNLSDHTVFFPTDCRTLLQSLQTRERTNPARHQTGTTDPQLQNGSGPDVVFLPLWHHGQRGSGQTLQGRQQVGTDCAPHVIRRNQNHHAKPVQDPKEATSAKGT